MKYVKMFGLLTATAVALMACAGTAAAIVTVEPVVGNMHLTSSNTTLHGAYTIECKGATTTISIANGATAGTVTTYDTTECGSDTVEVKAMAR